MPESNAFSGSSIDNLYDTRRLWRRRVLGSLSALVIGAGVCIYGIKDTFDRSGECKAAQPTEVKHCEQSVEDSLQTGLEIDVPLLVEVAGAIALGISVFREDQIYTEIRHQKLLT